MYMYLKRIHVLRYELWGLSEGYTCEYPLEMSVRPFSKHRIIAKLALLPKNSRPKTAAAAQHPDPGLPFAQETSACELDAAGSEEADRSENYD
jgi:hypothetical protein